MTFLVEPMSKLTELTQPHLQPLVDPALVLTAKDRQPDDFFGRQDMRPAARLLVKSLYSAYPYVSVHDRRPDLQGPEQVSPGFSVKLLERGLGGKVDRYLDLISAGREADLRRMVISTEGTGQRSLFVSYITATRWNSRSSPVRPSRLFKTSRSRSTPAVPLCPCRKV